MAYLPHFKINRATVLLQQGQIIAYPTEAVYGLGCDPLNEDAVYALLRLKRRPVEKGLILIASSLQQLEPYLTIESPNALDQARSTWPGPTTWVIPAQSWVPKWLTGQYRSLAVRVTGHALVQALCQRFGGPIVSTSANISAQQAAQKAHQIHKTFGSQTPYVLVGPTSGLARCSAIFDASSGVQLR